jgi:glutamate synthase domain-containing protein 1
MLMNLEHRGAVGADPETGDGAGILLQMPHDFMKIAAAEAKINSARRRRIWGRIYFHAAKRFAAQTG